MFFIVPLVGMMIALSFLLATPRETIQTVIFHIAHSILFTAGIWLGCMIIVNFLWDKFPWEHKPIKHLIIEVLAIIAYTNLFSWMTYSILVHFSLTPEKLTAETLGINILFTNLITFLITALHEAVFFYRQWKYNFSKSTRLEKDNIEAKYETLKSQVNPHFIFNSLNSLISMVDDNPKAKDYIQNLSEFLRYVIKVRERELVLVREELSVMTKYLSLQQSRFGENLKVNVNVPEQTYHYSVPPLVLQMLVENCIKHNVISKEKPLTISIYKDNEHLVVENTLQPKPEVASTGLGLTNITERYAFFTSREVIIESVSGKFKVAVPLLLVEF